MPSTPSLSQELRNAISQVLKNSPDGILIGDLETKLKASTFFCVNLYNVDLLMRSHWGDIPYDTVCIISGAGHT